MPLLQKRREQDRRKRLALWLSLSVFLLTLIFGFYIRGKAGTPFDYYILQMVHSRDWGLWQKLMFLFTRLGDFSTYVILFIPLIVILLLRKQGRLLLLLSSVILLSWLLNEGIKALVMRQRPFDFFLIEQDGYSFPSGHAMNAVSFYLTAGAILRRRLPRLKALGSGLMLLSFLPGLSRIFMGVHYPTDVLFGWGLGSVLAYGFVLFDNKPIGNPMKQ